ncbi:hypothetical protein [Salinibius halmophilus]|uniref:hypothetical protein n=1 Tax=Salinibius halmophilus TaxID=1853216 RepID=UPI000E6715AD|nr:hypothetical protein [Salinibius halmophilus]
MPERREPGLGDFSPSSRKPAVKQQAPSSSAPRPTNVQRPGRTKPAPKSSQGKLATVLAIIAIIATAAGGFLLYQGQQLQAQTLAQLTNQQTQIAERIDRVIADLENNGVATSESQEALVEQDEFLLSEIRKLWDLSNKRNRPNIEALQTDVNTLAATAETLSAQVTALDGLSSTLSGQIDNRVASAQATLQSQINEQTSAQNQAINRVQAQINNLPNAEMLSNISAQQQTAQAQVLELRLAVEALEEQINRLSAAAGSDMTLSQWISVMDASRIELSQRISALQLQLESPAAN